MANEEVRLLYPTVKRDEVVLNFSHGGQAIDSYYWLENTESEEVQDFVYSQNETTVSYLQECKERDKMKADLTSMSAQRQMSCPVEHTGTGSLYYFQNDQSGIADSLYMQVGLKGKPQLLISPSNIPSALSNSPSKVLRMFSLSRDGKILAYAISKTAGSKWMSIGFKDIPTGKDLEDKLTNVCMSDICWTLDGKGILYSCYNDAKAINHQIVFHRLGTDQLDDVVLVGFPDRPTMTLQAQISNCGEMIFVYGQLNDEMQHLHFFYGDFNFTVEDDYSSTPLLFHLIEGNGLEIQYITNESNTVFFRTNQGAPNFRIVRINLCTYDKKFGHAWKAVIPEDSQRLLDWAVCVKKKYLMVCYLQHASHKLELRKLHCGTLLHKYSLPIGTITEYFGDPLCPRFYFTFTSFLTPDCIRYIKIPNGCGPCQKCNPWGKKKIQFFDKHLQKQFSTKGYREKQLFCVNPGGNASVPVYVIHKKGLKLNGSSPCLILAQSCFGLQIMPSFSIPKWTFLRYFDGIIAVVGVRGGGEYGEDWYRSGCGSSKLSSYEDFLIATEFLIKEGYASPSKLILEGRAFGGNLAGVCLSQRPDLYSAVIIHDGLLDMLRFHVFPESQEYVSEFGNPEDEANFDLLRSTSPVNNIYLYTEHYPAVLAVLGSEKSAAHPSNSYKLIARLQSYISSIPSCCQTASVQGTVQRHNPCLLRSKGVIAYSTGEKPANLREDILDKIEEQADIFAFLIRALSLSLYLKK